MIIMLRYIFCAHVNLYTVRFRIFIHSCFAMELLTSLIVWVPVLLMQSTNYTCMCFIFVYRLWVETDKGKVYYPNQRWRKVSIDFKSTGQRSHCVKKR